AIEVEERLVLLDPESIEYRARVVQALLNLAHTQAEREQTERATETLRRAEDRIVRLARLVPRDDHVAGLHAQVERAKGELLRDSGDHQAAEEVLVRSAERLRSITARAERPEPWFAP